MIIVTNDKTLILPDFQGWSKKEIIGFCKLLNINYKTEGEGFVKEQSVKAGNTIVEGMEINFTLENKNIEEAK